MLKRSYRLRKDRDFQKLYRNGRRYTTPHFVVYYLASRFENTQVGFVVSKKVAKNAVVRNKLRRRASAVIEGYYPKISKPMHIIVLIMVLVSHFILMGIVGTTQPVANTLS